MQHPFKHPLATHPAGTILGFRTDGRPIYAIAGGNGEGEGGSAGNPPAPTASEPTPAAPATPPAATPSDGGDGTDWKAEARKWEERAKANKGAVDELATLKQSQMSEQEKAVAEAEQRGRTAASLEHGRDLAAARFEAAASKAGVDLGEAADLIDTARFVDQDGKVDTDGITAAVQKLAKLAPKGPGRSGGDMGGAGGSGGQTATLDQQIEEATKARDFQRVIALKRQKAAQTT